MTDTQTVNPVDEELVGFEPDEETTLENAPALTPEMAVVIDRAVRFARHEGYCWDFTRTAAFALGVPTVLLRDSDGFNCAGFGLDGYSREGFDEDGYDRNGFTSAGRNRDGYDKDGFDYYGINAEGFDRDGKDAYRFDRNGYDIEGYDSRGLRAREGHDWYERQAARPAEDFKYDSRFRLRPVPKDES